MIYIAKTLGGENLMNDIKVFTALGDSITYATGIDYHYGYVCRFCKYLKGLYRNVECKNFALPGMTSGGLLKQLKRNTKVKKSVHKADILTIFIGGNNLLKSIDRSKYTVDIIKVHEWIERFREDWPKIIHFIREGLSSKAQIYAMTLYNPLSTFDPNYMLVDYYVRQINATIADPILMQSYGYIVVDVYSRFESNIAKDWTSLYNSSMSLPDPHKSDRSHVVL